jgi:hypothetical protein
MRFLARSLVSSIAEKSDIKTTKFKEYKVRIIMDVASLKNDRERRPDFRFLFLAHIIINKKKRIIKFYVSFSIFNIQVQRLFIFDNIIRFDSLIKNRDLFK